MIFQSTRKCTVAHMLHTVVHFVRKPKLAQTQIIKHVASQKYAKTGPQIKLMFQNSQEAKTEPKRRRKY